MSTTTRIVACHRCKKRDGAACSLDRAPIELHARLSYCPAGKYGVGKPEGWDDEARFMKVPEAIPTDFDPAAETRRMKAGGCCGQPAK